MIDCMVPSCIIPIYLDGSFFYINKLLITYIKKKKKSSLVLFCLFGVVGSTLMMSNSVIDLQLCWPLGRWIWAKLNSVDIWMVASLCLIWCFWREEYMCFWVKRVTGATYQVCFSQDFGWVDIKFHSILHFSFHGLLKWFIVQILIYLFFKFVIVFFFSLSLYSPHELE